MEETEAGDTYVTQLKEVFDSCDTTGNGYLNESELTTLCHKLHLTDHTSFLIHHLLGEEKNAKVNFKDFKEGFVAVLTQTVPNEDDEKNDDDHETNNNNHEMSIEDNGTKGEFTEREVSPKFTLGRKKYGRRSRPTLAAEDDTSPTSSISSDSLKCTTQSLSSVSKQSKNAHKGDSLSGKRPVSPSYGQQPPSKSGRMITLDQSTIQKEENCIQSRTVSDTDFNLTFENNPVHYLQHIWKKLGVGKDGYLNVEELAHVCEHIGMDMTEEVIAQLFEKLDCDQDGQISFEEFLQGLFQHGEPQGCDSPLLENRIQTNSVYQDGAREDHQISTSFASGIFSCIDTGNTGYAEASAILELWESLELACSPQLLEELGFNTNLKINLSDLSSILEEELLNSINTPLGQLAFISYQNELQYLRLSNEQVRSERDKLRFNIEEANTRAALLAQEVDDNHARLENTLQDKLLLMEKKYQEQIRELLEELQQERETIASQTNYLKQQLQKEIQTVREEESKLKNRLNVLEQENTRLEQELQEATERYLEAERLNEALHKELSVMPDLKQRLADLESHHDELQEHHHQSLLLDLEKYKKVNQELQDKIDELTLEIENLHQQQQGSFNDNTSGKSHNRTNSWLSDYKKASLVGFKRRGSESSSDDNSDDESPVMGKVRRKFFGIDERKASSNCKFASQLTHTYNDMLVSYIYITDRGIMDDANGYDLGTYCACSGYRHSTEISCCNLELIGGEMAAGSEKKGRHQLEPELQKENCSIIEDDRIKTPSPPKVVKPNQIDILLKEMFIDRSGLVKKLQMAEELQQKAEQCNNHLRYKCKVLSRLLVDISQAAVA